MKTKPNKTKYMGVDTITIVKREEIADYIRGMPPITTIDFGGHRIGHGAGWVMAERFLKQGYRFVYDRSTHMYTLRRAPYTIECEGRYTFPERVIVIFNISKTDTIEAFFKTYHSQADYIDSLSSKKVILSYRMVEAPYAGDGRAWKMVVTKS